jgi:hypothetical protein
MVSQVTAQVSARSSGAGSAGQFVREADMLEPLLDGISGALLTRLGDPFFEVQAMRGVVDLLFVEVDEQVVAARRTDQLPALTEVSAVSTLLALTQLGALAGRDEAVEARDIAPKTSLSPGHLRRHVLPRLAETGWISRQGTGWVARRHYQPPARGMVAVEVKRSDWRRALTQAVAYAEFANASYVALDRSRVKDIRPLTQAFEFAGVGLLTVSSEPHVEGAEDTVTQPIAARRKRRRVLPHAVVAERIAALAAAGRRTGEVGDVFGRFLTTTSGADPRFL